MRNSVQFQQAGNSVRKRGFPDLRVDLWGNSNSELLGFSSFGRKSHPQVSLQLHVLAYGNVISFSLDLKECSWSEWILHDEDNMGSNHVLIAVFTCLNLPCFRELEYRLLEQCTVDTGLAKGQSLPSVMGKGCLLQCNRNSNVFITSYVVFSRDFCLHTKVYCYWSASCNKVGMAAQMKFL